MTLTSIKPSGKKLVRDELKADKSSNPNRDVLTQRVLDKIDPTDHEYYLFEFIKLQIGQQIFEDRNSREKAVANAKEPAVDLTARPVSTPQTFIGIDDPAPALTRPKPTINMAMVDARRAAALEERVTVNGVDKFIRELTYEDCIWISNDRQKRASEMSKKSTQYQQFADAIKQSGKKTLGEIPDEYERIVKENN